jgi:DNA repair photolyase
VSEGPIRIIKGRGTALAPQSRYERLGREAVDDGWQATADDDCGPSSPQTIVVERPAKTIITRNDSPDLPFSQSINPYLGCEHGCIYATHGRVTRTGTCRPASTSRRSCLRRPMRRSCCARNCRSRHIAASRSCSAANTDCYQPIEREWKLTRRIVEILHEARHPLVIVTKSSLVERDIDLLAPMAADGLAHVAVSVGLLDSELARKLEPRAAAPRRRIQLIRNLTQAGIPCTVLAAPIIPQLNDKDLEAVLEQASEAGATSAFYVMLRLPYELKELFRDWLAQHYPLRAEHVMSIVQQMRGGKDNDPRFGKRMTGEGIFAELIRQRFDKACTRLGLTRRTYTLRTDLFAPPASGAPSVQLDLFQR